MESLVAHGKSLGRGGRHEVWQLESRRIQSIGGSKGGQPARHGGERRKCAERSFQDSQAWEQTSETRLLWPGGIPMFWHLFFKQFLLGDPTHLTHGKVMIQVHYIVLIGDIPIRTYSYCLWKSPWYTLIKGSWEAISELRMTFYLVQLTMMKGGRSCNNT